jgi:hypothetical protein
VEIIVGVRVVVVTVPAVVLVNAHLLPLAR